MKIDRRGLLWTAASLPLAALLPRGARAATTINYWHHFTSDTEFDGLERVMALFREQHPDIELTQENIPNPEWMSKVTAAVVSGSQPDTAMVTAERAPDMVAMGGLTDLTDRINGLAKYERISREGLGGQHGRRQALRHSRLHLRRLDVLPEGLVRGGRHRRAAQDLRRDDRHRGQAHRSVEEPLRLRHARRRGRPGAVHGHAARLRAGARRRRQAGDGPGGADRGHGLVHGPLHQAEGLPAQRPERRLPADHGVASRPARPR